MCSRHSKDVFHRIQIKNQSLIIDSIMKLIYKKQKYAELASPANWFENEEKKQIKYEREKR